MPMLTLTPESLDPNGRPYPATPVDWTITGEDRARAASAVRGSGGNVGKLRAWADEDAHTSWGRVRADLAQDALWAQEDMIHTALAARQPAVVTANPRPGIITRRDKRDLTTGFGGMVRPGGRR